MKWVWLAMGLAACGDTTGTSDNCADAVDIPYDGIDQDCDGSDLVDVDGDGYDGIGEFDVDCDDQDPTVHPDATEVPYDGIDQNCFEGDLVDQDGDGEPAVEAGGDDCNDDDARVRPGAADQVGDGIDLNCDGVDGVDGDGDGWASPESGGTDCNDDNENVYPGAPEIWYDGFDGDCQGDCDYDQDGDGAVVPGAPVPEGSPCDVEPGPVGDAPNDCNDENPAVGEIAVVSVSPPNNALEVSVDTDVTVVLSSADAGATLVVRDEAGAVVPGSASSATGAVWVWSSTDPLAGGTTFTVEFTYGCGPVETSFTTEYPAVAVDAASLTGRVWEFDLPSAVLAEPANSGAIFAGFLEQALLVEVVGADTTTLDLRVAPAVAGVQDLCLPTSEAVGDLSANPSLAVGPASRWSYFADPLPFDLLDATVSGGIRGGGDLLLDTVVEALVDTRPMVDPFFYVGAPEDEMCVTVAALGDQCVDCPDGSGAFCLAFRFEGASAWDIGGSITERSEADIAADMSC